jgi:SAM-dependent methyltransferase
VEAVTERAVAQVAGVGWLTIGAGLACDSTVTAGPSPQPEDYVAGNRAFWEGLTAQAGPHGDQIGHGRRRWAEAAPVWGDWSVPESQLRLLPEDLTGLDTLELGCGTGYVSAWLARLGAHPVGVDLAAGQLRIARALQWEHDLQFPLLQADAERPPLADRRFDLVISEYGLTGCDPHRWVPQAARLLRPGGRLLVWAPLRCRRSARQPGGRPPTG